MTGSRCYEHEYVALDLETTGLYPARDRIVEIGALYVRDGEVIETFSTFVNPHERLKREITELTGIKQEQVDGAPDIEEVITPFLEFIKDRPLLGHNLIFDYSFIKKVVVNSGINNFEKRGVDTLKISRALLPGLESRSLVSVGSYFNIDFNAHRAFDDAKACHEIYQRFISEYEHDKLFLAQPLVYSVKKEVPATQRQLSWLAALVEKHHITLNREISSFTKNEASRTIDRILSEFGR